MISFEVSDPDPGKNEMLVLTEAVAYVANYLIEFGIHPTDKFTVTIPHQATATKVWQWSTEDSFAFTETMTWSHKWKRYVSSEEVSP
jgi:hypothetical protein